MANRKIEDLFKLYGRLTAPSGSGDLYMARAIDGRPRYRVAKDPQGCPALLIAAQTSPGSTAAAPFELPNLSFRPRCVCRLQVEGETEALETLSVLKCSAVDPMLREYFLRSISGLIATLSATPSEGDVAAAVGRLVELFRALDAPPRKSLQGVWCELFLIAHARNIRQIAAAWHPDPSTLYDFAAGRQRVEVKSSSNPIRAHYFRLDQLLPQQGTGVVIASFVLDETGRGTSIAELWDEISAHPELTSDILERLALVLALSLGRDWRKARRVAFDREAAVKQLRLYDPVEIPKVDPCLPVEVTEVRFKSELTNVTPLSEPAVAQRGDLFAAMFG